MSIPFAQTLLHLLPPPQETLVNLGGYTCARPGAWDRYLRTTVARRHPLYALRHLFDRAAARQDNDCVLVSLRQYLLNEFGVVIPRDTLFKVYNERGRGILPALMLEAITAVIEPLGLEIERVIVPDAELRAGLGQSGSLVDDSRAGEFEGRAGVCMINIENGYSHAFFWERMETQRFSRENFRLALTLRRKDRPVRRRSAPGAVSAYCRLASEQLAGPAWQTRRRSAGMRMEILALAALARKRTRWQEAVFHEELAFQLERFIKKYRSSLGQKPGDSDRLVLEAGSALITILQSARFDPSAWR